MILIDVIFGAIFFFVTTIYHLPYHTDEISSIASQPWLPPEKIVLTSGRTIVGYTLSTSDGWYIFLEDHDRTIDYFHSNDIASRGLCQLIGAQRPNRPPLIKLINVPAPVVPSCPSG